MIHVFLLKSLIVAAESYEPHSLLGVLGLLIISIPATVTAAGTVMILWRQRKTAGKVDDIQAGVDETNRQVKNGHPDPLRTDLDRLIGAVGDIHDELRAERRERREDVGELRTDMTRKLADLAVQIDAK